MGACTRTSFFNSGRHEPQFVPHCSRDCNASRRSASLPAQAASAPAIASSVTLKQVQTCLPRDRTATGAVLDTVEKLRLTSFVTVID